MNNALALPSLPPLVRFKSASLSYLGEKVKTVSRLIKLPHSRVIFGVQLDPIQHPENTSELRSSTIRSRRNPRPTGIIAIISALGGTYKIHSHQRWVQSYQRWQCAI